jgi:hypothetical protein
MKRPVLFVWIFGMAGISGAAPAITSVSGTVTDGQAVTIAGSGFGTKSTAAPTCYDDFESGSVKAYWGSNNGLIITSTPTQRDSHSTYNGYHNFTGADSTSNHNAYLTGSDSVLANTWYVSYWFYLYPNFNWQNGAYPDPPKFLSNIKFFRLWNPGATVEDFVTATQGWANQSIYLCENTGDTTRYYLTNYPNVYFTTNTWHHVQFAYQENSTLGAADGKYQMWLDGVSVASATNLITRLNDNLLKRPYNVGFYNSWSWNEGNTDASDVAPNEYVMDDVYVDTSFARVEIGDNSSYASCTHREVAVPSAWADGSVTATVKQGSFANGATAYVFVVDSSGNVSSGSPVTFTGAAPLVANPGFQGVSLKGVFINYPYDIRCYNTPCPTIPYPTCATCPPPP